MTGCVSGNSTVALVLGPVAPKQLNCLVIYCTKLTGSSLKFGLLTVC